MNDRISWMYAGLDRKYHIFIDGKEIYSTESARDKSLFISELMLKNNNLKLFKVYLPYGDPIVFNLYWAKSKDHVLELMDWKENDKPEPIIEEIKSKEGCVLQHHIQSYMYTISRLHGGENE